MFRFAYLSCGWAVVSVNNSVIQFSLLTGAFDPLRSCVGVFEYLPPNRYWWGLCVCVCVCVYPLGLF
jgi:hypothetical protein